MVHKFELPKWLIRGIEESFPLKNSEQTLAYKIHDANKNKRKLRVKLGIDPTGTDIHNIELYPKGGAKLVRSAGSAAFQKSCFG